MLLKPGLVETFFFSFGCCVSGIKDGQPGEGIAFTPNPGDSNLEMPRYLSAWIPEGMLHYLAGLHGEGRGEREVAS